MKDGMIILSSVDIRSVMTDLWNEEEARTMSVNSSTSVDEMMDFLFDGRKPGEQAMPEQNTQKLARGTGEPDEE